MTPAVAYARVSSEEQEREGYSLDAQLATIRDYARRHGLSIVREFQESRSAKDEGREQFRRMLAFIRDNPGVQLIFEKVDRCTRNWTDAIQLIKIIEELHTNVHFAKEGFSLSEQSKSTDHLLFDIKVAFARNYSRNLGEEASKGMAQKAREGVWPSAAPVGYVNTTDGFRKTIAPHPTKAPLVAHLFESFALDRLSLDGAMRLARDIGLTSHSGRPLGRSSLHRLLHNPLYCGRVVWKGVATQGAHQPLVSELLWHDVQRLIQERGSSPSGYGRETFALRGIVACHACQRLLTPERKTGRHGRGNYVYYSCKNPACSARAKATEPRLIELAALAIAAVRLTPRLAHAVKLLLDDSLRAEQDFIATELAGHHRAADAARAKLRQIYEDKLDGLISLDTYKTLRADYDRKLASAEAQVARHDRAQHHYFEEGINVLELAARAPDIFRSAGPEERRGILRSVLTRATYDGQTLAPSYKPIFHALATLNAANPQPDDVSHHPAWLGFLNALRNTA